MEGGAQTSVASKGERRQVNERSTEVDFQYACGEEASGQEGAVGPSAFNNAPIAKPVVTPAAATEHDSPKPQLQKVVQGHRFSPI